MPLYEFRCLDCGEFDVWRSIAEVRLPLHCPTCQQPAKRIFSAPAITLNVGQFSSGNPEPRIVQRVREPEKPRYAGSSAGRPWMINH
jgi:putative FmdB family regulatory protein